MTDTSQDYHYFHWGLEDISISYLLLMDFVERYCRNTMFDCVEFGLGFAFGFRSSGDHDTTVLTLACTPFVQLAHSSIFIWALFRLSLVSISLLVSYSHSER